MIEGLVVGLDIVYIVSGPGCIVGINPFFTGEVSYLESSISTVANFFLSLYSTLNPNPISFKIISILFILVRSRLLYIYI